LFSVNDICTKNFTTRVLSDYIFLTHSLLYLSRDRGLEVKYGVLRGIPIIFVTRNFIYIIMSINLDQVIIPLSYFYIRKSPTVFQNISVAGTTGIPDGDWHDLGATIGEGRFEYSRNLGMLELEGYSAPIKGGTYYDNETAAITVPLAELSYNNLYMILHPSSGNYTGHDIHFGGETSTQEFQVVCVVEARAGNSRFHWFCLYNAVLETTLSLQFSKSSPTVYEVTFRAVLDIERNSGQQLGKLHIET